MNKISIRKRRKSISDRFMDKVSKSPDGCWLWTASVGTSGYGRFCLNGKIEKSHRVSYTLFIGNIPYVDDADGRGTCIMHKCDNPLCVNPDHLFAGSHKDNMRDKSAKGRVVNNSLLGEKHQNSKLTEIDVVDIRFLAGNGIKPPQLSKEFLVSRSTIHSLLDGETWRHI